MELYYTSFSAPHTLSRAFAHYRSLGLRNAHLRDAVALTSFFAWLEAAVTRGVDVRTDTPIVEPLTEFTAGAVLDGMRAAVDKYFALSFQTIAGMGPNGAVIHYRADAATARPITRETFFLVDSGGNYLDGTTDVTRTLHFGEPSAHERLCYTRVLQVKSEAVYAYFPRHHAFSLVSRDRASLASRLPNFHLERRALLSILLHARNCGSLDLTIAMGRGMALAHSYAYTKGPRGQPRKPETPITAASLPVRHSTLTLFRVFYNVSAAYCDLL